MTYSLLQQQSEQLNNDILHKYFDNDEFSHKDRQECPECIDDLAMKDCVLVMGVNPSSSDLSNQRKKLDCIIKHVPYDLDTEYIQELKDKHFIYPKYFKKNYELLEHTNYHMLWECEGYLEKYEERFSQGLYDSLRQYAKSKHPIIFTDLIYIKETKASKILPIIDDYEDEVFSLFKLHIRYYQPKLILISNAGASNFILRMINKELGIDYKEPDILYLGTRIVFSSMVSGGVLDQYNFMRLKRDIEGYLK